MNDRRPTAWGLAHDLSAPSVRPVHGGPDEGPSIRHDFSTNAHPQGPLPEVLAALLAADRSRYPDPSYAALREQLGQWHGVAPERVLPTAGGAEAIRRLSLAALLAGVVTVHVPQPGFGDYAAAAVALGMAVRPYSWLQGLADQMAGPAAGGGPALVWICDPNNPTGAALSADDWTQVADLIEAHGVQVAVDLAYAPLRLEGRSALPAALQDQLWRLHCPNKALALTGVRAGYLLAPEASPWRLRLEALAPSWVLSAEGQALLLAWASAPVQQALTASLPQLADWRQQLERRLAAAGFRQRAGSVTGFWLAGLPRIDNVSPADLLQQLRGVGIKLRDASSFGLPGWVRIAALPTDAQDALLLALQSLGASGPRLP